MANAIIPQGFIFGGFFKGWEREGGMKAYVGTYAVFLSPVPRSENWLLEVVKNYFRKESALITFAQEGTFGRMFALGLSEAITAQDPNAFEEGEFPWEDN